MQSMYNANKPTSEEDERANNDFQVYAPDVVQLKLVRDFSDIKDEKTTFKPEYLNQIFGEDEVIVGYKDVSIDIFFKADTLDMYMAQFYDKKYRMKQCQDDFDPLERFLKKPVEFDDEDKPAVYWPVDLSLSSFKEKLDTKESFTPPGEQISGYTTKDGREFFVYRVSSIAEDPKAVSLLQKAQFMALLYIDALSYIDHNDQRWEIYFLFESYKSHEGVRKYAFAGYITVYKFYGHPHKIRMRISQVLIPPPFQRSGHGSKLLSAIYSFAREQLKDQCLEVSVEDPSVEFQALRDRVDYKLFVEFINEQMKLKPSWLVSDGPIIVWNREFWENLRNVLKLSCEQIRRCYELYCYARITNIENRRDYELSERAREKYMRTFRLDVKRRIYQIYDMKRVIKDPEERKQQLQEIWVTISSEYHDFFQT